MRSRIDCTVAAASARDTVANVSDGPAGSSTSSSVRVPSALRRCAPATRRAIANSHVVIAARPSNSGKPAVHDHEHVLHRVLDRRVRHAERAQHAPHERACSS